MARAEAFEFIPVMVDPGSRCELVDRIGRLVARMPPGDVVDLAAHLLAADLLSEVAIAGEFPAGHPLVEALGLGLGPVAGRA